jgi:hypothetical protein
LSGIDCDAFEITLSDKLTKNWSRTLVLGGMGVAIGYILPLANQARGVGLFGLSLKV